MKMHILDLCRPEFFQNQDGIVMKLLVCGFQQSCAGHRWRYQTQRHLCPLLDHWSFQTRKLPLLWPEEDYNCTTFIHAGTALTEALCWWKKQFMKCVSVCFHRNCVVGVRSNLIMLIDDKTISPQVWKCDVGYVMSIFWEALLRTNWT